MELGRLEAEVLGVVKKLGGASARDVLLELSKEKEIAYTTVSTTLDRLCRKGFLSKRGRTTRGGKQFVFEAAEDPQVERGIVKSAINRLVEAFGPAVIPAIYDELSAHPTEDLRLLRQRVRQARGK